MSLSLGSVSEPERGELDAADTGDTGELDTGELDTGMFITGEPITVGADWSTGSGAPQVAQKLLPGVLIRPQLEQVRMPLIGSSLRAGVATTGGGATGGGGAATTGGAAFTGAGGF